MSNLIKKQQVLDVAGKFVELAADVKDSSAVEHVQTQLAQYRLGLFRIVVVGEVKKGKSSFINALLGDSTLLPTASDVATSTVYKLMYGEPKKIKVFRLTNDAEGPDAVPPPIEISSDQLAEYGTEAGNPNNSKKVDFIGIQLPHPLLKDGVAIIDTPGLGGLFLKHRDITWRYVPNADAIFFVLDSVEAVISQAEVDMLLKLRERNPLIFFVQTKIDLVEETQWKKWRERNLAVLSEKLGIPADKIIYFPVSAKLKLAADANHSAKHLERSGYSTLLYFLYNKLLAKKEDQMGRRLLSALSVEAAGIHRKLSDSMHIVATETKEGLDALERSFVETKAKYDQWKATDFQGAVTAFQDRAVEIKRKTRELLQEQLDPSPYSPLVAEIIGQIRGTNFDPRQANEQADAVLAACVDRCSQIVLDVQGQYNDQMHAAVNDFSSAIGKSMPVQIQTPISGVTRAHIDSLNMQFSGFEEARNTLYGGMAGAMMANIGVGLLGLVFPPLAAAAGVAALIGAAVGGWKASDSLKGRRQEEAIARLQSLLSDTVRKAQSQAMRQFEGIAAEYEKGVRNALQRATSEVEKEIADKVQSIADQRQRSREDSKGKAEALKQALGRTDEVLRMLARLATPEPDKG
jgi:tRNA U34 5-carboxymethylaminomethyl modifying GTPase MnmE/TrmE